MICDGTCSLLKDGLIFFEMSTIRSGLAAATEESKIGAVQSLKTISQALEAGAGAHFIRQSLC